METLTLEIAKTLKGKKISTMYTGYAGQDGKDTFVVGDIISEFDLYKRIPYFDDKFPSYADYWKSYMSEEQLNDVHSNLVLLDENGTNHYIYCHINLNFFEQPTFTCSDADREVRFTLVD